MAALSAKQRHYRAQVAALTVHRDGTDPVLVTARRNKNAADIEAFIERKLAEAPPLTDEQRAKLAELLKPVRGGAA